MENIKIKYIGKLEKYGKYIDFVLRNVHKDGFQKWVREEKNNILEIAKKEGYNNIEIQLYTDILPRGIVSVSMQGKENVYGNTFQTRNLFQISYLHISEEYGEIRRIQKIGWSADIQPEVYMIVQDIEIEELKEKNKKLAEEIRYLIEENKKLSKELEN